MRIKALRNTFVFVKQLALECLAFDHLPETSAAFAHLVRLFCIIHFIVKVQSMEAKLEVLCSVGPIL